MSNACSVSTAARGLALTLDLELVSQVAGGGTSAACHLDQMTPRLA
jgi:hypothetical protein